MGTTGNDGGTEKFKEESGEVFGDVAGSSPRVPSNTPSIRDERQPSITLSDCPPDTVRMMGRKEGTSGGGGQTLHSCPGNTKMLLGKLTIKGFLLE